MSVAPASGQKLPYDVFKDLAPVTIIADQAYYLLVSAKMNIKSLKDFVAYAKANPGKASIGVVTAGPHEIESNALVEALDRYQRLTIQAALSGDRGIALEHLPLEEIVEVDHAAAGDLGPVVDRVGQRTVGRARQVEVVAGVAVDERAWALDGDRFRLHLDKHRGKAQCVAAQL